MPPRKRKGPSEGADTKTFKRVTRSQSRGDVKEKVVQVKEKKKSVKATPKSDEDAPQVEKATDVEEKDNVGKTIIVEHCTQCTRFKKRAVMVKEGLVAAVPGVNVVLNPVKPRKGCFEIREEGEEPFVSLLNMKRPFEPMTELVMEDVIAGIIDKIKE